VRRAALSAALAWCALAEAASAQTLIRGLGGPAGFGPGMLPAADDIAGSVRVDLAPGFPTGIDVFGTRYMHAWVNVNGNITFGATGFGGFTPDPFPQTAEVMLAPWWADVDTRGTVATPGENTVYWTLESGRLVVTWYRVGYFASHVDLLNSFQLVVMQAPGEAAGVIDVELRYEECRWTTGDVSMGIAAQAGFDAGDRMHFLTLPGSRTSAILDVCTTSNVAMPGVWRFSIRGAITATCGNSLRETGEACEDGNTLAGDGCSATCQLELDAGPPDAGPIDAGPPDARTDAGRDSGPPRTDALGGGCTTSDADASWLACAALAAFIARRRRERAR
jgi:cysteine-rich repeat protein